MQLIIFSNQSADFDARIQFLLILHVHAKS